MNMKKELVVVIWVVFVHRTFGISITFDPAKPALGESVTISCKQSSLSSASVSWELDSAALTVCDGLNDDICIPSPTGHTFSTDVSARVFNLSLASVTLADCKTYACTDGATTSDTDSKDLSIAKYDASETVLTDPGDFLSGTIVLTTGCVLSSSDVTISWKKVNTDGVEDDLDDEVTPTQTTNAAGCADTCHSEISQKVVSSFVHTEYNGTDVEEVIFRAYIRHSSYPQSMKDSGKHQVKGPGGFPIWQIIVIVIVICFLSLGIILGVFMYYVNKDWNIIFISVYLNTPWPVWISCLIVVGFGILIVFVIKHISARIGIHNSKNNRTSPNCTDTGSNTGNTISTPGNPQPPNSHEEKHPFNQTTLHTEDGSAAYTKKKPPTKLRELDEAGSEKHHLGGRPLPEIGTYNKT